MKDNRIVGGAIVTVITTIMCISGGLIMVGCLLALSICGLYELYRLMRVDSDSQSKSENSEGKNDAFIVMMGTGIVATLAWFAMIVFYREGVMTQSLMLMYLLVLMLVLMTETVFLYPKYTFLDMAVTLMGIFYVSMLFSSFYLIRTASYGKFYIWYIFAISWGSDVCAYFTGLSIGKHKMTPKLSPKKTIEGAVGGVVGAVILSTILGATMSRVMLEDMAVLIRFSLVTGLVGGVVSEIGDLFASSIKRVMNIKDFSKVIPGHGGVLDRFDSTLMVAPVVLVLLYAFQMI